MRVAVDARYLCEPFGSMTVFCRNLLEGLTGLELEAPPVALIPRAVDPSADAIVDDLADRVQWLRPPRDLAETWTLTGELRWVHREVPAMLARSIPGTDVVIMAYHHPPARTPGVQRVVVLHDLCGLGAGFPRHKSAYWRHYLRLRAAAHLADGIWPISRATHDDMTRRFPASRSRLGPVVHNGVDRRAVDPGRVADVLAAHGLERGGYAVAFATWQERKNFGASLAALQVLQRQGTPLRLVGIAPEGERDGIRERCRAAGLGDAVLLSGVADEELDALYAGALALLWPSTCEGFGYPVVEAMAQGCPPLVADHGPGAELIGDAIEPLSSLAPQAIAARLDTLRSATPAERERRGNALVTRAATFSSDDYREHLRAALDHVAAGR